MKAFIPVLLAIVLSACSSVPPLPTHPITHHTLFRIEALVRTGHAGSEVARMTNGSERIEIREAVLDGFPFQVFIVCAEPGRYYTLLVEDENTVVTLCGGFGGGIGHDFSARRRGDKTIVSCTVALGSGMDLGGRFDYVLGSGGQDGMQRRAEDQVRCGPLRWTQYRDCSWAELVSGDYQIKGVIRKERLTCAGREVLVAVASYTAGSVERIIIAYARDGEGAWELQYQRKLRIDFDEIEWFQDKDRILFVRGSDRTRILEIPYANLPGPRKT